MSDTRPPHPFLSSASKPQWRGWLALALVLGVIWLLSNCSRGGVRDSTATPREVTQRGALSASEQDTIELFRQASPSVVYITTVAIRQDVFNRNLFEIPQGSGSGFIWDRKGRIITNYHVIQDAGRAKVTLSDQSVWDAQLVGIAPSKDLAVLVIDAPSTLLTPLAIGASSNLQVGQTVLAIGNPFGLDHTLTTGIISALGREIKADNGRTITSVIQTDAAINPGNSGGPLLDSAGRLIGVNTAIYSPSGSSAGIGFAVPVDTVNRVVPQLIRHGRIIRPALGIRIDDAAAARWDLPGVPILQTEDGGAAQAAGLRGRYYDQRGRLMLGDLILKLGQDDVKTSDDLLRALENREAGQTVKLEILRGNQRLELPVTLQKSR